MSGNVSFIIYKVDAVSGEITKIHWTTDAFHSANQPLLELVLDLGYLSIGIKLNTSGRDLGAFRTREKVDHVNNAIFMNGPRL